MFNMVVADANFTILGIVVFAVVTGVSDTIVTGTGIFWALPGSRVVCSSWRSTVFTLMDIIFWAGDSGITVVASADINLAVLNWFLAPVS